MNISEEIGKIRWVKRWAGSYTFISCAYWGFQYYSSLELVLGVHFDHTLFIHRKGVVSFYLPQEEFRALGENLALRAVKDPALTIKWLQELKNNTDVILSVMKRLEEKIPTWKEYQEFLIPFEKHLPYHNFMKKTVDFLSPESLKELLPLFTDARLYSESVYSATEAFFRKITSRIAKQESRRADNLTCLTQEEVESYIKGGNLPGEGVLEQRFIASILYFKNGSMEIGMGDSLVAEAENLIASQEQNFADRIKGVTGYKGKVKGVARVIHDPFRVERFDVGDILVTGMTRPEFLPVVQKAGAIVTDAGGVLCHAAIVARELKKPCIVGTEVATSVIKDGDMVEVDANTGVVSVISNFLK